MTVCRISTPTFSNSSAGLFPSDRLSFDVSYLTHNTVDGEQIAMTWISSHTESSTLPVCYTIIRTPITVVTVAEITQVK